jgi:transposase
MGRCLCVRKPTAKEYRQLSEWVEESEAPRQRRRSAVLVFYAAGFTGEDIARALQVHPNTVYADLQAFAQDGLDSLRRLPAVGARPRIAAASAAEICRIAKIPPGELGLEYGRWSLANLRDYFIKKRTVREISREHLRQMLKKGVSTSGSSSEN